MKTTSVTITKENVKWNKLATLIGVTFEANKTYTVQARQGGLEISLNTAEPTGFDYITVGDGEKFAFTYDGENDLWIKPQVIFSPIVVVVS